MLFVLVGFQKVPDLGGRNAKFFDVLSAQNTLNVVGSFTKVGEGDSTDIPTRLTLGIGDPLVGTGSWVSSLDLDS